MTDSRQEHLEIESDDLNNAEKMLLMLLAAQSQRAVPGNLWTQKEMFLLAREFPSLEEYLEFEPHLQGPFSETVNNLLENLEYMGLAERTRTGIQLTGTGEELAQSILDGTDEDIIREIEETKESLNDLSKSELLAYVYHKFPKMTTNSVEKADLEEDRQEIAVRLYQRGKIDIETAAEIGRVDIDKLQK
jgi:uncharacterized protein YwgA